MNTNEVITGLMGRLHALETAVSALIDTHPDPVAALLAWRVRATAAQASAERSPATTPALMDGLMRSLVDHETAFADVAMPILHAQTIDPNGH